MKATYLRYICTLLIPVLLFTACSADDIIDDQSSYDQETVDDSDTTENPSTTDGPVNSNDDASSEQTTCTDPLNFIFNEKDGLLLAEFEDAEFTDDWKLKTDGNSYSGDGYMVWEGAQSLGDPGNGRATFTLNIVNPGTYEFIWYSAVTIGDNGTDHNDTWLRFNDADDFYGQNSQGTSIVYPKGTGKTPNPEGATKDGWFKIYRSGNDLDFKWQATTYDNNGHNVFVVFNTSGNYVMEISARSSGHAIDKFALFNSDVSKNDATASTNFSAVTCD